MLITTDLTTEAATGSFQQTRAEESGTSRPASSATQGDAVTSQLEPSLQRLIETPSSIQDADFEIQDQPGASQAVAFLRQSMMGQPATALAAQANQSYKNVLGLLPASDQSGVEPC
jgi:hypothetical protein